MPDEARLRFSVPFHSRLIGVTAICEDIGAVTLPLASGDLPIAPGECVDVTWDADALPDARRLDVE
jgi:hypothetical protein